MLIEDRTHTLQRVPSDGRDLGLFCVSERKSSNSGPAQIVKRDADDPGSRTRLDSCNPCENAATRSDDSGSSAATFISAPIRRIRSLCCARAVSGHAAAPPSSAMNERRFIR